MYLDLEPLMIRYALSETLSNVQRIRRPAKRSLESSATFVSFGTGSDMTC